jgi:hypothetical protein
MDDVLQAVLADPAYQANLNWGKARRGHAEGTVRAHIAELEENLEALRGRLDENACRKLRLLIHVHDAFKAEATRGVPIEHPRSHASLARAFLARYCEDADLLAMVQYHDEGYALWKGYCRNGNVNAKRLERLLRHIGNWDLFLAFCVIDACTSSKSRDANQWFVGEVGRRQRVAVTTDWIEELDQTRACR